MAKSGCGKLGEKALKIDAFGRPFEFVLPNGTKRYKSLVGSLLTVFLVLIVALYTAYKLQLLLNNDQVFVMVTTEDIQDVDKVESALSSSVNGFNIAVGLFNFEDFSTVDNFEEYGQISIEMRHRSEKFPNFTKTKLQLHPCTSEEISFPDEDGSGGSDGGDQGTGNFFPFEGNQVFVK